MVPTKVEISSKTIVFAVFFLIALQFLWIIKDLIFSLFIALIIVSALKPLTAFLEEYRIPRVIASFIIYILFLFFIGNIFALFFPPLISELTILLRSLPGILQRSPPYISSLINIESLSQYIPNITNKALDIVKDVFSNALFVISTLFFGFYLLLEESALKKILLKFYEEKEIRPVLAIIDKAEKRLNAWFWGELTLMVVIGVMTYIGLNLIGMRYALALSVLAGLLEAVPNIGPVISMIPAVIIGFSNSLFLGLANISLYFVIQQLENNLIVPLVMKKIVGLNPIVTLMALMIGGKVAGVLGVLLSVPLMLFLETILIEMVKTRRGNI